MGRKGTSVHFWNDEDEQKLLQAMKDCEPLREHYKQQGYNRANWWDAVAGRLVELKVTGMACKRRWEIIDERNRLLKDRDLTPEDTTDAWAEVAEKAYQYERDLQESMYDDLLSMNYRVMKIERFVVALWSELTGLEDVPENRPCHFGSVSDNPPNFCPHVKE